MSLMRTWQTGTQPPQNKFFYALVCHVEKTLLHTVYFLCEATKQCTFYDLEQHMQRAFPRAAPVPWENVEVNQLAMMEYNDSPHRVRVLQLDRKLKSMFVERIDYGDTLPATIDNLYEATEYMLSLPPFVFAARIQNATNELRIDDCVSVCWLAQQFTLDGLYLLTLQQKIDKSIPARVCSGEIKVTKKHNLRAQVLFVESTSLGSYYELFFEDIQNEKLEKDDATLKEGQIVAAKHKNSWKRAYLLCQLLLRKKVCLVYLLDEGLVIFCSELRYLPAHLILEEPRLHVLESVDRVENFKSNSFGNLEISKDAQFCTLSLDKAYRVKVLNLEQLFFNCNYGFWFEELQHGDRVNIVSVESVTELWVAGDLDLLREVLERLALYCAPWVPSVNSKDWQKQLVVAQTKTAEGATIFLRGHITYVGEDNSLKLFDIDTRDHVLVEEKNVKLASDLVRALPAKIGCFKIHMKDAELTALRIRKGLDTLKRMAREKTKLELVLMDEQKDEVDMMHYDEQGTCHLLSDSIFGAANPTREQHKNYCTFQQLVHLPLPEGPEKSLYVIDTSELKKGKLSVASFTKSLMATMKLQDNAMHEHCKQVKPAYRGFEPRYGYLLK